MFQILKRVSASRYNRKKERKAGIYTVRGKKIFFIVDTEKMELNHLRAALARRKGFMTTREGVYIRLTDERWPFTMLLLTDYMAYFDKGSEGKNLDSNMIFLYVFRDDLKRQMLCKMLQGFDDVFPVFTETGLDNLTHECILEGI